MTISEVSRNYNISTRTLRYYEEVGLLESKRKENYAYRVYDDSAVRRLQQIVILRKLRIPLKKITTIINNQDTREIIEIFQDNIEEFNSEINYLVIIRDILLNLINKINEIQAAKTIIPILSDENLVEIITSLVPSKINLKENHSMEDLKRAHKELARFKNVRVIYIPEATVAASRYIGENPEDKANEKLKEFIEKSNLVKEKPDFRVYGFNNPCPRREGETYGYEFWVTIPENMIVPEEMEKKHFEGGLYFAHCIKMGDFHEWREFYNYAMNNEEYEIERREPLGMDGAMEEELNAYSYYQRKDKNPMNKQLDLLIPIKIK